MSQKDNAAGLRLAPEAATVAFDVEGTLTTGTAWEGIRDYLVETGRDAAFKGYRRRQTPRYVLYRLGLGDAQAFKEQWVAGMLRLLAGLTQEELADLGRQIVARVLWPARRADVLQELAAHQKAERRVVLVSGQFRPFLDAFVEQVGATAGIGTAGLWQNGRFTGQLAGPFTTGEQKAALLRAALGDGRLLAAYGDTAADIPLLALSEQPTAVYPDDGLRREAAARGWRVLAGRP